MPSPAPRGIVAGAVAALVVATGCPSRTPPPDDEVQVFTAHQFLTGGSKTKHVGEACAEHGNEDCAGQGVCLRVRPEPDDPNAFICTLRCGTDQDCPQEFGCRSIFPSGDEAYCLPIGGDWIDSEQGGRA